MGTGPVFGPPVVAPDDDGVEFAGYDGVACHWARHGYCLPLPQLFLGNVLVLMLAP